MEYIYIIHVLTKYDQYHPTRSLHKPPFQSQQIDNSTQKKTQHFKNMEKTMITFFRGDGVGIKLVYEEDQRDLALSSPFPRDGNCPSLDRTLFEQMNDILDRSYNRRGIDYIRTRWSSIEGNLIEEKLFMYTFFMRMGREFRGDEYDFTSTYQCNIDIWEVEQLF